MATLSPASANTSHTSHTSQTAQSTQASRPSRRGAAIIVGSRGSDLALWQTNWALERVRERRPSATFDVRTIRTQGDHTQARNTPLARLGDKGIFVAELERALLAGALDVAVQPMQDHALAQAEAQLAAAQAHGDAIDAIDAIDAAVHSLKDLPSVVTPGLALAAITAREDPRDALVSRAGLRLAELPQGATVATSSLRRRAQLLNLRPDLRIVEIRGNVDTRLRKALAPDGPDATILAAAGMLRLGLERHITEYLAIETLTPAAGQGALAVETRADDRRARRLLRAIDDPPTRRAVLAERAVLAALGGGCLLPLGAHATISPDGATMRLLAVVADPNGGRLLRVGRTGRASHPLTLGRAVARELLRQGAGEIVRAVLGR